MDTGVLERAGALLYQRMHIFTEAVLVEPFFQRSLNTALVFTWH